MLNKLRRAWSNRWVVLGCGLVLGALTILLIRFVTYSPPQVHYHANFAVYINGQRQLFRSPAYYEEVSACRVGATMTPVERAHMHNGINSVIHVHDRTVTWEQFFNNIGWGIGNNYVATPSTVYVAQGNDQVHYILNGQDITGITDVANTVIRDGDRLLVSYGNVSPQSLRQEFASVPSTARSYDTSHDPASCAGTEPVPMSQRLRHLL